VDGIEPCPEEIVQIGAGGLKLGLGQSLHGPRKGSIDIKCLNHGDTGSTPGKRLALMLAGLEDLGFGSQASIPGLHEIVDGDPPYLAARVVDQFG
jgi:hypothetical protein